MQPDRVEYQRMGMNYPKQEAVLPAGTPFGLRDGVLLHCWHDRPADFDPAAEYQASLKLMAASVP